MAMIYCKECGKEISDKADKCPNCGCPVKQLQNVSAPIVQVQEEPKMSTMGIIALVFSIIGCTFFVGVILAIIDLCKKDGRKKTCSIIALIVCAIWVIAAIAFGGEDSKDGGNESGSRNPSVQSEQSKTVNDSKDEPEKEPEEVSEDNGSDSKSFDIGETAEYKGIQVTLIDYEESEGNDWGNPEDGNIFVFPEIEISNSSDEEITVSSMISFECYIDDYKTDFSSNAFMAISVDGGKQQLDGSVAPGKKLKGVLGIEAPEDWKVIEIYYKDNFWLDSNFSFKIEK